MEYSIKLLGAKTGQGHISALRAVEEVYASKGITPLSYPTFYEDAAICNEIMSDFNNILAMKSTELSVQMNELFVLEGDQIDPRRYEAYLDYMKQVLSDKNQIVISFTPLINKYITKYLKECYPDTRFYVVVTDPYYPMYPGFEAKGAKRYFCPSEISKKQLMKREIPEEKIEVTGFPLRSIHLQEHQDGADKMFIKTEKTVVIINCGVYGNPAFITLIKEILSLENKDYYYVIVTGKNKMIGNRLTRYVREKRYNNVAVLGFIEDMNRLLDQASICITKAGANAIHECIAHGVVPFIVGFWGLQYQERGVFDYLRSCYDIDIEFEKSSDMVDFFKLSYYETRMEQEAKKLTKAGLHGAEQIVSSIINDIEEGVLE